MRPRRPPKPIGRTSRALLVCTALHWQQHKTGPVWGELRRACRLMGEPRGRLVRRLEALRRRGLVEWVDGEQRSLRLTPRGYAEALNRGRR